MAHAHKNGKAKQEPQLPFPSEVDSEEPIASSPSFGGKKKRVAGGVATSDVTVSAHVAGNADVFPQVLALHVPCGSKVADVTYGKGVF
jgi:hypothetical protein